MLDLALDNRLFLDTPLDMAIQELDLMFNTCNTELINDVSYGTNFEQFLWSLTPMTTSIKKYVDEKIDTCFYASKLQHYVDVQLLEGEYRAIYQVTIVLYDKDSDKYATRKYQYQ